MNGVDLGERLLALGTKLSADRLARGELDMFGWNAVVDESRAAAALPLWIDDSEQQTLVGIRARIQRLQRRHGLGLVIVDHLGLIEPPPEERRHAKRVDVVSEITRGLKVMAKALQVPVIALCQLNRGVEGREDKRPHLADLRDSGSIEADADAVLLLYREAYYLRDEPQWKGGTLEKQAGEREQWHRAKEAAAGKVDIIVAKLRQGRPQTIRAGFDEATMAFSDLGVPLTPRPTEA